MRLLRIGPVAWLVHDGSLVAKAIRFGLVGATSAGVFSIVAVLLIRFGGVEEKIASLLAYIASMPVNFVGNRNFAFASKGNVLRQVVRFCLLHAIGMVVTASSMATAVDALQLHYGFGVIGAIVFVPLVNFVVMSLWVFRGDSAGKDR